MVKSYLQELTHSTLFQLIQLLNDGHFHDGDTLGQALGISRAAVWKIISKLEHYGVPLQRIKHKGYQLTYPLSLLNVQTLYAALHSVLDLHYCESLDSTQSAIKQHTHTGTRPLLFVTEQQSQGRGRFQRTWHSPFGQHLYLTLEYPFQQDLSELSGLSLMVALSMQATCQSLIQSPLHVRWPNDLIAENQKLGGCLIEVQAEAHGDCTAWIGIGLNVNAESSSQTSTEPLSISTSTPWTSLSTLAGHRFDRTELLIHLIRTLLSDLKRFSQEGFSGFLPRWNAADGLHGKSISIHTHPQAPLTIGIASGVNERGHLILQCPTGEMLTYASGDISLLI